MLRNKQIILGVSGSIAAYKAVDLASRLSQAKTNIKVVMTKAATAFVTPLSFSAISGHTTVTDLFSSGDITHINITAHADCIIIAPATANTIAKLANGIGDNALTSIVLAAKCPLFIAPAMNERMWLNKATQANVALLRGRGVLFIGPRIGALACGDTGIGRMAEPDEIINYLRDFFIRQNQLANKHIIITAGGTEEIIDSIRFIGNRSSGKMGYALAEAAKARGAEVTLIAPPSELTAPGVRLVNVRTAADMHQAVLEGFAEADAVIMSAAVSDYHVANTCSSKIKKNNKPLILRLEPNVDILEELGKSKESQVLIGFAAEADDLISNAQKKLVAKNLDFIIANDINQRAGGFASNNNQAVIISNNDIEPLPLMTKRELADIIIDRLSAIISNT